MIKARVLNISDTESLSDGDDEMQRMQKVEGLGVEVSASRHIGDDVASSSGTNLRSSFIGMGFSPSLIDKVIKEKGEDDADMLLDTLFAYSAHEKSNSESSDSFGLSLDEKQNYGNQLHYATESNTQQGLQSVKSMSSDSLDSLLGDENDVKYSTASATLLPKEDPDVVVDLGDDKRASLLMMNFAETEVDFAFSKLGKSAPIDEMVDFIVAAQIAESEGYDDSPNMKKNEDSSTEALFGTMDKTLQLLKMGFNEHEVSLAIEKLGSAVAIRELADCICATQMGEIYKPKAKLSAVPFKAKHSSVDGSWFHMKGADVLRVKTEDFGEDYTSQTNSMSLGKMYGNVKTKEENFDESFMRDFLMDEIKGKRPIDEFSDDLSGHKGPMLKKKSKVLSIGNEPLLIRKTGSNKYDIPNQINTSGSGRGLDKKLSGPPYFFYGNVVNLSAEGWQKVSQFLYALQPEVVHTQSFSALYRKEGYIHNLPTEYRVPVQPKSPMTIEEVMPHTKKWWPSWDTRKQLTCINSDTIRTDQVCSHLGKMLKDSRGKLSEEKQTKLLHYCRIMNLVWVGPLKLGPMEPEYLERILGYPINHTQNPDMTLVDRLESLSNCFQTDTLGYHLSVLKPLYPGGITVLSIYSGIGGAEVAFHRLGIYMKAVISVESSETRRKILRRWWQSTDQTGELVQIEDIQKLTSSRLEYLMKKFGGFDFIICQNPCTYAEKNSKSLSGSSDAASLDFTSYYEFVRVLQRVRTMAVR